MLESIIISTLAGSIICTALLIFKNKLLSLLGGKALYYISLIAMLVFILPMNIGDISLPKVPVNQTINVTEFEATVPDTNTDTAPAQVVPQEAPQEVQHNAMPQPSNFVRRSNPITMQEILLAVWLLGFIISICRYFVSYFRFKKKICGSDVHETINGVEVIKSPLVASPLVFGFFKPTLAIPEFEMNEEDYNLAIKHEMVHYKHHDSWFKLFAVIVNSICWFNPITYFMVDLIGEACEYACDEQVTKEMDIADKKQYSTMILSMVCQSSPALSSNMVKSKKQLKRRFEMIMKKKRFSVLRTALCTVLMLALTCGSIVLANEVAPLVSSLLKDDYVYISTYGYNGYDKGYNEIVPVEKNGEYYLPLREFLNKSDVENDKIKYNDGIITIELWTTEMHMISTNYQSESSELTLSDPNNRQETVIPSKYSWSTMCKIDSKEVEIAGEKHLLANAPYIEEGVTYVPYEYIKKLKLYEDKAMNSVQLQNRRSATSKFSSLVLFGFDSTKAEFYTDYIQMEKMVGANSFSSITYNAEAKISKTGYRTDFEASYDYLDLDDVGKEGNVKIKLNKVTRIYSKGSDIEGLFTVEVDGKTVYDNQKGIIMQLPIPAGDGVLDFSNTRVKIGELSIDMFFNGFNYTSKEYDERAREIGKMTEHPDTVQKFIVPSAVKLNGKQVSRGSKMWSLFRYNKEKKLIDVNIQFDNYNGNNDAEIQSYRIHSELDSKITVIDENTISAELYFTEGNNNRIDSFDAVITFLPDEVFELKSTDGKYIIKGSAKEFVPQWQWSEEQKNAPVPAVFMINE